MIEDYNSDNNAKEIIVKNLIESDIECRPLIAGNLGNKPFWYENFEKVYMKNSNLNSLYDE